MTPHTWPDIVLLQSYIFRIIFSEQFEPEKLWDSITKDVLLELCVYVCVYVATWSDKCLWYHLTTFVCLVLSLQPRDDSQGMQHCWTNKEIINIQRGWDLLLNIRFVVPRQQLNTLKQVQSAFISSSVSIFFLSPTLSELFGHCGEELNNTEIFNHN